MGQRSTKLRKNSIKPNDEKGRIYPTDTIKDISVIKREREKQMEQKLVEFSKTPLTKIHLVVDDLDLNRDLIIAYLRSVGLTCDGASNGEEALSLFLKGDKTHYDIIWIDITMPIMDGYELTQKLRSNGYNGVIIGITGNVSKESVDQCYECGMNYVCAKPLLKFDLLRLKWFDSYPGVKEMVDQHILDNTYSDSDD